MKLVIIITIASVLTLVLMRFIKYTLREVRAINLAKQGVFNTKYWDNIPFTGTPISMAFTEVAKNAIYQKHFILTVNRFIYFAQVVDNRLDAGYIEQKAPRLLECLHDPRLLGMLLNSGEGQEDGVIQAAFMYALLCTQLKGEGIRKNLMEGNNKQGVKDFSAKQTEKTYFSYINKHYPNLCQMICFLEPRKSYLMLTVIGYLILDGVDESENSELITMP